MDMLCMMSLTALDRAFLQDETSSTMQNSLHWIATLNYLFAYVYLGAHDMRENFKRVGLFPDPTGYLTNWNMLIQTVLFAICTVNDIAGTNEAIPSEHSSIRQFKDKFLACLAFPLSMFVGLTFWVIYFIDRELVFPKALDAFFPVWLNHVMHTNIMLFVVAEMATSRCSYPSRKFGLTVTITFMAFYLVWLHVIRANTGYWVYPILNVLSLPLRIVFFAALLGLIVGLYVAGEKLNSVLWSKKVAKVSFVNNKRD